MTLADELPTIASLHGWSVVAEDMLHPGSETSRSLHAPVNRVYRFVRGEERVTFPVAITRLSNGGEQLRFVRGATHDGTAASDGVTRDPSKVTLGTILAPIESPPRTTRDRSRESDESEAPLRRSEDEWLVAYYLARCGVQDLETGRMHPPPGLNVRTWNEAFAAFFEHLGGGRSPARFRNSLKNARDSFDAHVYSSGRVGWRAADDARSPGRLGRLAQQVLNEWSGKSDDELEMAALALRLSGAEADGPSITEGTVRFVALPPDDEAGRARRAGTENEWKDRDGGRRSREAKLVGDRGEAIVLAHLREDSDVDPESIRHLPPLGLTPGWDIECKTRAGTERRIEVKSTVGGRMRQFELSENERRAAMEHGAGFELYAVTSVFSRNPRVHRIADVWGHLQAAHLRERPVQWLITGLDTGA